MENKQNKTLKIGNKRCVIMRHTAVSISGVPRRFDRSNTCCHWLWKLGNSGPDRGCFRVEVWFLVQLLTGRWHACWMETWAMTRETWTLACDCWSESWKIQTACNPWYNVVVTSEMKTLIWISERLSTVAAYLSSYLDFEMKRQRYDFGSCKAGLPQWLREKFITVKGGFE